MDAVKYFKEKRRMLDSLGRTGERCCGVSCSDCPLDYENSGMGLSCGLLEVMYPERAIEIVEKWSDEHPHKTFLSDFLEKYPKAKLYNGGTPTDVCPDSLGYCEEVYCSINESDCVACWNRPLEE